MQQYEFRRVATTLQGEIKAYLSYPLLASSVKRNWRNARQYSKKVHLLILFLDE